VIIVGENIVLANEIIFIKYLIDYQLVCRGCATPANQMN
jgi:hypothetical protein